MTHILNLKRNPALTIDLIGTTLGTATLQSKDNDRVQVPLAPLLSTSKLIRIMVAESGIHPDIHGPLILSCEASTKSLISVADILDTGEIGVSDDAIDEIKQVLSMLGVRADLSKDSNEYYEHIYEESPVQSDLDRNDAENQPNVEESPLLIADMMRQELEFVTEFQQEIVTSGNNLKNHHEVFDALENKHTRAHKKFKEDKLKSIKDIEERLGESGNQGASYHMDSQEATVVTARRSLLDESVLDCGKIVKKIPTRELAAITPKKLKVEEDHPEAELVCNFVYCERTFTCASSLVSHLKYHYAQDQVKIDCPYPGCGFSNTTEKLTTHMRARHTGEKLFSCQFCPTEFHTMGAQVTHEKKHSKKDLWAQCVKQHCRKFYQVAKGNCRSCGKK